MHGETVKIKNQFAICVLLFMDIISFFILLILRKFCTSGPCWHL